MRLLRLERRRTAIDLDVEAPTTTAAFADFYRRHHHNVYRFIRSRAGDDAAAEDLTADTFVKALTRAETFEGRGSYRAWILSIAANTTSSWHTREPQAIALDETGEAPDPRDGPSFAVILREEREFVRREVTALPWAQREVVSLHYFGDLTVRETARACGKSDGAVRVLLYRARRRLRERLQSSAAPGC